MTLDKCLSCGYGYDSDKSGQQCEWCTTGRTRPQPPPSKVHYQVQMVLADDLNRVRRKYKRKNKKNNMKKYLIALVLMVPVLAFGADDQSTINPPVVTCDTAVISGMAVDNFDQPGQETFQVFLDGKDVENLIKTNKSYVWFWEAKIEGAAGEHEIILYGADRNQELRFTVPACEPTPSVSQSSGVSSSGRHGSRALTHDQMCAKGLFDAKECAGKDLWAKFVGLLLALQK